MPHPTHHLIADAYTGNGATLDETAAFAGTDPTGVRSALFDRGHPQRVGSDDPLSYQWLLPMRARRRVTVRELARLRHTSHAVVRTQLLRHRLDAHDPHAPPIDRADLAALLNAGATPQQASEHLPGRPPADRVREWADRYRLPDPAPVMLDPDGVLDAVIGGADLVSVMHATRLGPAELLHRTDDDLLDEAIARRTDLIDAVYGGPARINQQLRHREIDELKPYGPAGKDAIAQAGPLGITAAAITVRLFDCRSGAPPRHAGIPRRLTRQDPTEILDVDDVRDLLATGWRTVDIAALHATDPDATRRWVDRHGLSEQTPGLRRYTDVLTPEFLAERFADPTASYASVAAEVGAARKSVIRYARRHGITPTTWADVLTPQFLTRMVDAGLSATDIAAKTGASRSTVERHLAALDD
ncbi:hypothetical protein DVS28_b0061 (plasmid) [Euzebya pacifica]|uniref:Homeodomain-like domain-containing protein n=1 Tax=Euzebya pacifica TaxID=1608957 RepID=A0A346Y5T4_9ACTN|nr:hypothetical protein [Euzebya pacifica]AXV09831.1 hypothetical protein DVS28_b0061 [Euzebya pacifica]